MLRRGRQVRFKRARGRTSLGAEKWLDTPLHQGTPAAVAALRAAGYRVAAAQARPPDLPWAARPSCWHSNRSGRFGMPLYMQTCSN